MDLRTSIPSPPSPKSTQETRFPGIFVSFVSMQNGEDSGWHIRNCVWISGHPPHPNCKLLTGPKFPVRFRGKPTSRYKSGSVNASADLALNRAQRRRAAGLLIVAVTTRSSDERRGIIRQAIEAPVSDKAAHIHITIRNPKTNAFLTD